MGDSPDIKKIRQSNFIQGFSLCGCETVDHVRQWVTDHKKKIFTDKATCQNFTNWVFRIMEGDDGYVSLSENNPNMIVFSLVFVTHMAQFNKAGKFAMYLAGLTEEEELKI